MLQKILVVLVGLVMSVVGALSPAGLFASQPAPGLGDTETATTEQVLATVAAVDGRAFARLPVLWVEVDGRRVTEDAWGTGDVKEMRFKVGVKDVDAVALLVGEKTLELHPTDVVTVRMFHGDFSYRGLTGTSPTLQLQGSIKTATLSEGAITNRIRTEAGGLDLGASAGSAPSQDDGRVSYVVLDTGAKLETLAIADGGERLFTEAAPTVDAAKNAPGNLLARWVKLDGKLAREYTWGDGPVGRIEFEPAEGAARTVVLAFNGAPTEVLAGDRVVVTDFVGEYVVYQINDGLVRLRLDGYAASWTSGAQATLPVQTGPGEPLASFSWSPALPKTTDVVQFRDASSDDGVIVFREWSFGDGAGGVLQDPTHRFRKPGTYDVTLTVTDNDLRKSNLTRTITVANAEPVPDFDFSPKIVTTGTLVGFTDRSYDPDNNMTKWTWDFGDGATSTSRHPTHQFLRSGNVTVTLTVEDELGGFASLSKVVVVRNTPPLAQFGYAPADPQTLVPVQFTDGSSDRDGRIVQWNWSFGDGAFGSGSSPAHAYPRPGLYTVTLTVTDDAGDTDTASTQVLVRNRPALVDFSWTPEGAPASHPVRFISEATDPDGVILSQEWDWGDGSPRSLGAGVSHSFPRAGTYNVTLVVTDSSLATSFLQRSVTIANSAPRPVMGITPVPAYRGSSVSFVESSNDPDGDAIVSRVWDFGDGNTSTSQVVSHTYDDVGVYAVTLTVTDAKGQSASVVQGLRVLNRPPIALAQLEPSPPVAGFPAYFNASGNDPDGAGPLSYHWNFSDGVTLLDQHVTRTFTAPGDYTATLTVTDSEGAISSPVILRFRVDYAYPVVAFTWTPNVPSDLGQVNFTDASTSLNGDIRSWSWDFGDGTPLSTRTNPSHVYSTHGSFRVGLTVTDVRNRTSTGFQEIYVNARPEANFQGPTTPVSLGEEVQFTDYSSDEDGNVMSWFWEFGDGATSTSASPTHAFGTPGRLVVRLTVTDDFGATSVMEKHVDVLNQRPVSRWIVASESPRAGEPVQFVSTGHSYDPDGTPILNWTWDFGDRSGGARFSHEADPVHSFPTSGRYPVSLRVNDGQLDSAPDGESSRIVRILSNHAATVTINAVLPGERPADLFQSRYVADIRLYSIGQPSVTFTKEHLVRNGTAFDLTLPAGAWLEGDALLVSIRDTTYANPPGPLPIALSDAHGLTESISVRLELPMPLVPTIKVAPGENGAILFDVLQRDDANSQDGTPIYRDFTEAIRGSGTVHYLDGVAASGVNVDIEARWLPLKVLGPGRATAQPADLVVGWCRVASALTDVEGNFTWSFRGTGTCLGNLADVHLAGRWEFRARAYTSFATTGESASSSAFVDPTGGILASLPLA